MSAWYDADLARARVVVEDRWSERFGALSLCMLVLAALALWLGPWELAACLGCSATVAGLLAAAFGWRRA